MENKSNKVLLTVIGAATLLVALVGATFAYFSAQSTTTTKTVTTGSSSITLTASDNSVENIKPTTFSKEAADDGSNTDIVKITLSVSGSTTTSGTYDIAMNEPTITLQDDKTGGNVSDIKYAVYNGEDEVVAATSFTGTATSTPILSDIAYSSGTLSGTYDVYVWIENKNEAQDKLQDISFDLTFTADATTSL